MKSTIDDPREDARAQLDSALAFLRRARRFWWVIAATLAVGALACAVFLLVKRPTFRSETVILYSEPIRPAEEGGDAPTNPRGAAVRLEELLLSRSQLERLVRELDLYPEVVADYGLVDAVVEFRKHVQFRAPGGDTFSIGFEGASPEQAQQVTSRLADALIHEDARLRNQQAKVTRDFLDGERKRTEKTLQDAEQKLAEFMSRNPRFALDTMMLQTGGPITGAAIRAGVDRDRAAVPPPVRFYSRPAAPRAAEPAAQTGAVSPAQPVVAPADPQNARQLAEDKARAEAAVVAARADLQSKQAQFTDAHPDVRSARAAVEREQARLAASLAKLESSAARPRQNAEPIAAAPRTEARRMTGERVARTTESERSARSESSSRRAADVVTLETDWATLTRGVTEARKRHDLMEAAFFKADVSASSESGMRAAQMSIVDPAYLPLRPVPPGRLTIMAIFAALALMLGSLIALALAAVDDRICDGKDAAELADVLVEVPRDFGERRAHAA
jgi:uncharacterized protein involved in exopolysaccharide biosynthesis